MTGSSGIDNILKGAFASSGASMVLIIALGVSSIVGVVSMVGGAKAGLKWIKGVFWEAHCEKESSNYSGRFSDE